MAGMNVSITLKLVDQLTAAARAPIEALKNIGKTAQEIGKTGGAAAADQTKAATKAAEAQAKTAKQAQADIPTPPPRPANLDQPAAAPPGSKPAPRKRIRDFLQDVGDAPKPIAPPVKPAAFADLPQEAGKAAGATGGLMGAALASARQRVAATIQDAVAQKLGGIANDYIAAKSAALLDPVRAQLASIRTQFPALAPAVDAFQGKMETVAAFATTAATNMAGRAAMSIGAKVGGLAAGMIGLPGLAIGGAVLAMANWTKVKSIAQDAFASLPAPAQAAMTKVGGYLAQTPLAAVARGFDGFAGHVEKVFDAAVNGGEQRWSKLRELLVDQPKEWASGAFQGLKDQVGTALGEIAEKPREKLTAMANSAGQSLMSIPKALGNIGVDLAESLTGMDLSGVRQAVNGVVDEIASIPGKLVDLGARIGSKIAEGDWSGAVSTAVEGVVELIKGIPSKLGDLAAAIGKVFTGIDLKAAGAAIINSLKEGLENAWKNVSEWLKGKAAEIRNAFTFPTTGMSGVGAGQSRHRGSDGQLQSIPGRAAGGPVKAGGLYKVGEAGEELFVPGQDGSIVNAADTRRLLTPAAPLPPSAPFGGAGEGGGGLSLALRAPPAPVVGGATHNNSYSIAIHGAPTDDPENFARRLWDEMDRVARGSLHDGVDK